MKKYQNNTKESDETDSHIHSKKIYYKILFLLEYALKNKNVLLNCCLRKERLDRGMIEATIQNSLYTATIPDNSRQNGGKINIAFIIFLFGFSLIIGFVVIEVSKEEK